MCMVFSVDYMELIVIFWFLVGCYRFQEFFFVVDGGIGDFCEMFWRGCGCIECFGELRVKRYFVLEFECCIFKFRGIRGVEQGI